MHMYETTTGIRRKNPGYTGLFAIICLFASIFLAWAIMRTSLVKTSLEMMSSPETPPGTMGLAKPHPPLDRSPGQPVLGK
jgi:hypothetical protein